MNAFNIMKLKDFAKEIKTPESTIRTWKRRGDIPDRCFKIIGTTIYVIVPEMQQWLLQTA